MSCSKRPLEDPVDRAQKYRKVGLVRLKIDQLGFHEWNRGGAGVIPYHVHEVAHDCLTNKVALYRYDHVDIVKVPLPVLAHWRAANKTKCLQNTLMPGFAPNIAYACLTKTHFVHALRLGAEGGRTLYNAGKIALNFPDSPELSAIREDGVLCSIYSEDLWADDSALKALMLGDNLNAAVQAGEDEMQAFGRVDSIVLALAAPAPSQPGGPAPSQRSGPVTIDLKTVHSKLEEEGFGKFSSATFIDFIKLRLTITHKAAEMFRTCQQHSVGFRVQVKSSDYQLASTLDARASLLKIAVILTQYYSSLPTKKGGSHVHFEGTARVAAKKLNPSP